MRGIPGPGSIPGQGDCYPGVFIVGPVNESPTREEGRLIPAILKGLITGHFSGIIPRGFSSPEFSVIIIFPAMPRAGCHSPGENGCPQIQPE